MAKVKPKQKDVVYVRCSALLVERLRKQSERVGVSGNALVVGALGELCRVLEAEQGLSGVNAGPSAYMHEMGPYWIQGLLAAGVENEEMRIALESLRRDQAESMREREVDRIARAERSSSRKGKS